MIAYSDYKLPMDIGYLMVSPARNRWEITWLAHAVAFAAAHSFNHANIISPSLVRCYLAMVAPSQQAIPCRENVIELLQASSAMLTDRGDKFIWRDGRYFKTNDNFWFDYHIWPRIDHDHKPMSQEELLQIFSGLEECFDD